MYKGNNPTALKSQKILLESLNELLKEKEFKDISVSEICSHSGISRQTFYSLFDTKENILAYQLEQVIKSQQPEKKEAARMTLLEMCGNYSKFVIANYEQLKMIIDNGLMDLLYTQFCQTMSSCRESYVNLNDEEREYAALFMSAGLCSLTQRYVNFHAKPNQEELTQLAYKMMSGSIYRL